MSYTLNLARLVPLSHRCLSLSKRSYELPERCQFQHYAGSIPDLTWRQKQDSHTLPSLLLLNETKLTKQLCSLKATKPAYLLREKFRCRLKTHLMVNINMLKISKQPVVLHPIVYSSHERGYHENHYKLTGGGSTNISMTLAATLAILGIFKKSITGDIDEERARLSDAEKLDRMRPIERKIAIGVLWMCDQEYTKANQLFHEALHMAQEEKDDVQENLVLNLIATNYFESGDWENAEKLFIDLIKRMIANDTEVTSPAILELSLKLASIYSKTQATHEKALKGFKFVINSLRHDLADLLVQIDELNIQELSDEKRDALALLGWSYDWFAKHLLSVNDYNGAADMLQRAWQISSKVLGQLHDQTLILLNDIGTTLAMNDSPEEGRAFIEKAVEGAIETQSKELASFYVNLGLVNLRLNRLQEAKRYCEYSIEIVGKNREHHNAQEVIDLSRNCISEVKRLMEADLV